MREQCSKVVFRCCRTGGPWRPPSIGLKLCVIVVEDRWRKLWNETEYSHNGITCFDGLCWAVAWQRCPSKWPREAWPLSRCFCIGRIYSHPSYKPSLYWTWGDTSSIPILHGLQSVHHQTSPETIKHELSVYRQPDNSEIVCMKLSLSATIYSSI